MNSTKAGSEMRSRRVFMRDTAHVLLCIIIAAAVIASQVNPVAAYTNVVYFTPTLYPPSNTNYFVGQQIRVKLSAKVPSGTAGFNRTTVRVSIAAMYPGRAQSGIPVPCNSSQSSVFFDSGELGIKTYTSLGRYIVADAYATFTVPPFPWRICVLNKPAFRSQYYSIEGQDTVYPRNYTEVGVYFRSSTIMQEGDFAAIAITAAGSTFPYSFTVPGTSGLDGDSFKLVPVGAPCAMERVLSRETAQAAVDYCGTNKLNNDGSWKTMDCLLENSVANGVANMGTNSQNPFISAMSGFPRAPTGTEQLVAYLQLPAYATYDVCYSPLKYRQALLANGVTGVGQPLWFKLMAFTSACTSSSCPSRTRLQVTARLGTVTWSSISAAIAGSYGSIRVRGAGDLNTNPCTKWDPNCPSCTKEYFNTTGGDVFRLVQFRHFYKTPAFTAGTKITITGTSTTFAAGSEKTVIAATATGSVGSVAPNPGCWVSADDNYGTVETPMGMSSCSTCERGFQGQTASGDLGGDPRSNSGELSFKQDLPNQFLTYARVRIPTVGGTWRVCYRKAGINNWQYLDWDSLITKPYQGFFQGSSTNMNILTPSQMNSNFTYILNDTRKGSWAQIQVWSTLANMETTPSTFFSGSVVQASVRGAMLKVVDPSARCDDVSQTAATTTRGGLPECTPGQCGYVNGSCYGCTGSSDNNPMLRRNLAFNVLLPSNLSSVRVCFRNRVENWRIITPRRNKQIVMPLTTATDLQYTVSDIREGSWGRFTFTHSTTGRIDTSSFTSSRGSMFRLVPLSARCDLQWTASGSTVQDFNNRTVDYHLGVYCSSTGAYPCDTTNTARSIGNVVGSTPYTDLNPSTPSEYVTAANGFALIPAAGSSYRVCFKEAKGNWLELSPQLTPQSAPQFSLANPQTTYVAGSYSMFTVAATNNSINASTAIFKVVLDTQWCQFPALGTYGTAGLEYTSFSIAIGDGSRTISSGSPGSNGLYAAIKFYLTLPTLRATPTTSSRYQRRICFMPENLASSNWVDLGLINIMSYSVGYTLNAQPINGKQFSLTILAGSDVGLTTGYNRDAVKIVPLRSPCASNETGGMPYDVSSYHAGMEIPNQYYNSVLNLTSGITYTGPSATQQSSVSVTVTLPGDSVAISYRVCYKLQNNVWMELLQAPVANRVFDLGANGFITSFTDVYKLVVDPILTGIAPAASYNYGGFLYPNLFIAGSTTTFDPTTIGGSGSVAKYFSVTGTGLSTSDTLRIVNVQQETQSLAQYTTVQVVSCADASSANYVTATYNPSSVTGGNTVAWFQFMLPITPGRYLFCYQKSGSSTWYQPGNAALNPAVVISSSVYGKVGSTQLTILDGMQSLGANLGSLNVGDRVYLKLSTATCGVGTAYDAGTILSEVTGLTLPSVDSTAVYNTLLANSPAWFPVATAGLFSLCYTKAVNTKTVQSAQLLPILNTNVWYRIPFYINGFFNNDYRKLSGQASLVITCPTSPLTTGVAFDVPVSMQDPTTNELLASPVPVTFTVAATNSFTFINSGGSCQGSTVFNKSISSKTGTATFSVTVLSACPVGGCSFKVVSDQASDSAVCTFTLAAANAISSVQAAAPVNCVLGAPCPVTLTALDSGNAIVYASSASVSFTQAAAYAGLGFKVNGGSVLTDVSTFTTSLTSGVVTVDFAPVVASASGWPVANPYYNVSITATISSITSTLTFSAFRPTPTAFAISAVTIVDWDGTPSNDVNTNQHLRWEPSATFNGFWDKSILMTSLRGGPNRPWIAGQYYSVRLSALDPLGQMIIDSTFVTGTNVSLALETSWGNNSNVIIGAPPSLAAMHSYVTPLSVQTFQNTYIDVIFRLKNADGCSMASPCNISFTFGANTNPSKITTSVRSVARKMVAFCGAPGQANSASLRMNVCPSLASIESGVTVAVRAVDQFGNVDEYFNGDLYVNLLINNKSAVDITPTTVGQLKQFSTAMPPRSRFVNGEFFAPDFTLSHPCRNCFAQFFSDWNAGYAWLPMNITPSTARLNCKLSSASTYYVMNSDFSQVQSVFSGLSGQEAQLMIYPTTDICFDISAVSATGNVTYYENIWVNFAVAGQGGAIVTGTAAQQTPYVYKPLNFSMGRFCINVQGNNGDRFAIVFIAQQFSDPDHWAHSYTTGQCVSPTYRLTTKRLIGGLKLTGLTGIPSVSGASTGNGVWGRQQLADVNQQYSVTVSVLMLDHYGNSFVSGDLANSQVSFFLTPGTCSNTDISGSQCSGNGAPTSKLSVIPLLPIREGGVLSVVLQTASYTLISSSLFFTFNVRRWCLFCNIPIIVFSGGAAYQDPVLGVIQTSLSLSFLIPTSLPLYTAFRAGNSPFFPSASSVSGFTSTKWRHWLPTSVSRPSSANGAPMIFFEGCFNGSTAGCSPNTNLYSYGKCASANPEALTGADGGPMQFVVYRSSIPMSYGESVCVGDCYSGTNVPTSQIDIFTPYNFTITAGTQRLQCLSSNAVCIGDKTRSITVSIPAMASTVDAALIALRDSAGNIPAARLKIVGVDASDFTSVDAITGSMLTGGGLASKAGPLVVSANSTALAANAVNNLTSTSGTGAYAGLYYLMWRGPARATQVVVRPFAVSMQCPADENYFQYVAPTSPLYNGYLQSVLLDDIRVNYSNVVIPVNTSYPFTVEIQDTNGNLVPSASGTYDISVVDWTGCGNGGTASITSSTSFSNGRATLWIKFSDSCQNCNIRFDLTVNVTQSDLYELVMNSARKQSVVVSNLVIGGSTQGTATAAFATSSASPQAANVSIDDAITFSVAPFFNVGGLAVLDNLSSIRIEAYNFEDGSVPLIGARELGGDGGFLRLGNQVLNFDPAAVYATGVGSASLIVKFQRACQSGCKILVVWRILSTKTMGSFFLANNAGTTFYVTAPNKQPLLVSGYYIRRTIRYNAAYPYAVRVALSTATIPFVGWDFNSKPALVTPTSTVVDGTDGTSGVMSLNVTSGLAAYIYHLNFSEPCYECLLAFGPQISVSTAIQPTATQLRVNALQPLVINPNDIVTAELYASDDMGYVDFSIGGQVRCPFEIHFLCTLVGRTIYVNASQDGVTVNNFYPATTTFNVGGTSPRFNITPVSGFAFRNGKAQVTFNVSGQAASVVPVFSDGFFSSAPYPTYGFSVNGPLGNLFTSVFLPNPKPIVYEVFEVRAAMTFVSNGVRYVAPNANHTLLLTLSGDCTATILDKSAYQRTRNGQVTFSLLFTAPGSAACQIMVTSVDGNGNCTACSAVAPVLAAYRAATSWDFLLPTPTILPGTSTAVLYGSMQRVIVVKVQLYNLAAGRKIAQSCSNCALLFTPSSCSPAPSFSPSGGAIFDANGTATIRMAWQISRDAKQNSTIRTYSCTLSTSISGPSIDGPYSTAYTATICYPSKLVLINSTFDSDVYHHQLLTSRRYTFAVGSVDPYGTLCPGDSQYDVSTVVRVSLEYADGTPISSDLQVINLNRTSQSVNAPIRSYNNTVFLLNGLFYFSLVFTNTTTAPVRLRFTATSTAPSISMSVYTAPFQISSQIANFNIYPSLPKVVSSFRTYNFSLFAGDLVPFDWLKDQNRLPNVYNSSADYYMMMNGTFFTVIPITFVQGQPIGNLVQGASQMSVKFDIPAGFYAFYFFSRYSSIGASSIIAVRVQTPYRFAFVTIGFYPTAQFMCSTDCFMSVTGTTFAYNETTAILSINTPRIFNYAVALVDENDQLVTSETGLTISCSVLKSDSTVSANIAFAPSLVQTGPLSMPMVDGLANYSIGFIGSTLVASGDHAPLKIQCMCSAGNCPAVSTPLTLPIIVTTIAASSNISTAIGVNPVVKIPTTMTSLNTFNETSFRNSLLVALSSGGVTYIQSDNAELSLPIIACEVQREFFGFADLRGSVCGALSICNMTNNTLCPPFVYRCRCPTDTVVTSSTRGFEEMALTGRQVQIEVEATLANAPAFQPVTTADVVAAYLTIQHTLYDSLSQTNNPLWTPFTVLSDTVVVGSSADATVGATQTPQPGVFITPVPATPVPSAASSPMSIAMALLVMLLSVLVL